MEKLKERIVRDYKIWLSVIIGSLCLVGALYAPLMSKFLLTEQVVEWDQINWILLATGIIFLWGRIVAVSRALSNAVSNRLNKE